MSRAKGHIHDWPNKMAMMALQPPMCLQHRYGTIEAAVHVTRVQYLEWVYSVEWVQYATHGHHVQYVDFANCVDYAICNALRE